MMPLAQLGIPDPAIWWGVASSLVAILAILVLVKTLMRSPPIEVEFATKRELIESIQQVQVDFSERMSGVAQKIERVRMEFHRDRQEDKRESEKRTASLEQSIGDLRRELGVLRESQNADTKIILEKIGEIRGRYQ